MNTMRIVRLFVLTECLGFIAASLVHRGILVSGYEHSEAANAEAIIAAVLAVGLVISLLRPGYAQQAAVLAQAFALVGTLVGLFSVVAGFGPQSTPDVIYHVAILALISVGLAVAVRARPFGPSITGERRGLPLSPVVVRRTRRGALGMLIGLLVEFVLGMVVNLFVEIPADHPGAHPASYVSGAAASIGWAIGSGLAPLALHVAFGLVLMLGALGAIVPAWSLGRPIVLLAAVVAALSVVFAGLAGAAFLAYGADGASLFMALMFGLALFSYAAMLYLLPPSYEDSRAL